MRNPSSAASHGTAHEGKARSHADEDVAPPISEDGCFRRGRRWRCRRAYASLWEPHQLDITRLTLALPSLPKAFDGMKVVQFSDLHLGFHTGQRCGTLGTSHSTRETGHDLFHGDMVDGNTEAMRAAIQPFTELKAPLGLFHIG